MLSSELLRTKLEQIFLEYCTCFCILVLGLLEPFAQGESMDIGAISAIISSIKTATDIAKLIKDSDISLEKAEFRLKPAELISALADAKIQVAEIQQALEEKDAKLRRLHEQIAVKQKLH
jgi:hypothetical protein